VAISTVSVSRSIAAPPERLFALVTDLARMGESSPENTGGRWAKGADQHYRPPGWVTRNIFNRFVAFSSRHGVSVLGSRVLKVKGRSSGAWRSTPVNLLELGGRRYLVSQRGEGQWVRNLRVAGRGDLAVGRRTEAFTGRELDDGEKLPVLRAYLRRWKMEVGVFFDGVGPDSTDAQLRSIAPRHPAFKVLPPD